MHLESSSGARPTLPFDTLKLNIQNVLKQDGTVQLLERRNAEEMQRIQVRGVDRMQINLGTKSQAARFPQWDSSAPLLTFKGPIEIPIDF